MPYKRHNFFTTSTKKLRLLGQTPSSDNFPYPNHKGGRNSNAKPPVKFYKAGIDRENAPLIRTCLASQPPNVSFSFTLSTAPSASARCSPGRAPPLGWWGISTSGRLTMPKNFASVLPSSINID